MSSPCPEQPAPAWLSTRQMAQYLAISKDTLLRMRNRGVFQAGRDYRHSNPLRGGSPLVWHRERVDAVLSAVTAESHVAS